MPPADIPSYDELLAQHDGPAGSAWHVFGADDQLGTLNFLTPDRVAHAATLVRSGKQINLDYPVNAFEPFPSGTRHRATHHLFANNEFHRDDWLDSFYLQSSSQIDSLRHIGHPQHGFYGGRPSASINDETTDLGIHHYAQRGIAGRGVLLDIERYLAGRGEVLDPGRRTAFTVEMLEGAAQDHGVEILLGDMIVLRTGWASHYTSLDHDERVAFNRSNEAPGLAQQEEIVRWLWNHQVALIAADNAGVECSPTLDSDFTLPGQPVPENGYDHNGMLHRPLIPLLGMAMGEMWALEELAADCAADGVYEFFLVRKPLNVLGGAGSPANAMALK